MVLGFHQKPDLFTRTKSLAPRPMRTARTGSVRFRGRTFYRTGRTGGHLDFSPGQAGNDQQAGAPLSAWAYNSRFFRLDGYFHRPNNSSSLQGHSLKTTASAETGPACQLRPPSLAPTICAVGSGGLPASARPPSDTSGRSGKSLGRTEFFLSDL